jgi:hypothetical protein
MPKTKNYHHRLPWILICIVSMAAAQALNGCIGIKQPVPPPATTLPRGTPLPATQPTQAFLSNISVTRAESRPPLPTDPPLEKIRIEKIAPATGEAGTIYLADWSVDGESIAYLMKTYSSSEDRWYEFQVSTHSNQRIDPIIQYDPTIWKSLGLTNPQDQGYDPVVQGYISPSGHNLLVPVNLGEFSESRESDSTTQIWLITDDGDKRKVLLQMGMYASISRAYWPQDETTIIFDVTTFGGDIYIYDLEKQNLTNFSDLTHHQAQSLNAGWYVSPMRDQIAIPTSDELTRIFTLDGKVFREIPEYAVSPSWTPDQKHVCYWSDHLLGGVAPQGSGLNEMALHCFDEQSLQIEQLFTESEIHRQDGYPDSNCKFIVSSDQKTIAFNDFSNIWILQRE